MSFPLYLHCIYTVPTLYRGSLSHTPRGLMTCLGDVAYVHWSQALFEAEEEASMTTARTGLLAAIATLQRHCPYMVIITNHLDSTPYSGLTQDTQGMQGGGDEALKGMYEVLFDYLPEDARLLKVEAGQRITVVGRREDWLLAIDTKGHMGFVPPTYVRKEVEEDDDGY